MYDQCDIMIANNGIIHVCREIYGIQRGFTIIVLFKPLLKPAGKEGIVSKGEA